MLLAVSSRPDPGHKQEMVSKAPTLRASVRRADRSIARPLQLFSDAVKAGARRQTQVVHLNCRVGWLICSLRKGTILGILAFKLE